ncbi:helix-turn-helix domain-containing protein [Paracoccus benzoatiresistens]|uniref:Helix-turn-helix domain-containing protein n=2 Tax=Paracoccus benzoatiresistens TaxID=2997341 RepID=A0ABT4JCV2_9RHOB|nr:helix-turn-helix domain-containing protein [Paracoccus sp. EF6]MCZ0964346.1 helix-turn-helix domain-containing protein [Paracoccus sp. EF6]
MSVEIQMDVGALLLRCEIVAARIDGILLANPDLAGLWRTEVALLEAAASVGLEGERISTAGMVMRLTSNLAIEEESRTTEMALRMLSVLKRPGNIFNAPVETMRRIEAAASPVGQARDETDRLDDRELALVVDEGRRWAHFPILAGWRAAAVYAFRSRRESPAAERLVFMAVEGAARHLIGLSPVPSAPPQDDGDAQAAILMRASAGWILAPSVAMARNGLRIWSPLSGIESFLDAASRALSQDLGQLGTLRHELSRLDKVVAGVSGRSRMGDLVALLSKQPVVNSAMVCDRLGVSRRTALALIEELEEASCLVNVTGRRSARFWALPSLASQMRPSAAIRRGAPRAAPPAKAAVSLEAVGRPGQLHEQFDEDRLNRIMENLDAAMAGLEAVVRRRPGAGEM